jgi:hypothetical protein
VTVLDEAEVERLLVASFADATATITANPDLFARVELSIAEAAIRRRFRMRLAGGTVAAVLGLVSLLLALSNYESGRLIMPWWVLELVTNVVLVVAAIALGPFIKRFGRAYAADVFAGNPATGKSYLVLTDVAYYLIFAAYILLTTRFVEAGNWQDARPVQLQHEISRVGGMLLLMGALHTANVLALPVIGNLLNAVHRDRGPRSAPGPAPPTVTTPPLGPGTWTLRIEAADRGTESGNLVDP